MQQNAESIDRWSKPAQVWDALVVGAGIAGLAAARVLLDAGLRVLVIEKSRGIGGRTSSRRGEGWIANLGAQIIVTNLLDHEHSCGKMQTGSAPRAPWAQFLETQRTHLRSVPVAGLAPQASCYIHSLGISAFCKTLVSQNIAFQMRAVTLEETATGLWSIEASDAFDSRHAFLARNVFLTSPLPQALALLNGSPFANQCAPLARVSYDPCIVMIMRIPLDLRAQWPAPVWMLPRDDAAGNSQSSLNRASFQIAGMFLQHPTQAQASDVLAVHLSHASSRSLWNETDETIFQGTLECMFRIIREWHPKISLTRVHAVNLLALHRWRYSRCREPLSLPFFKVITQSSDSGVDPNDNVRKSSPSWMYLAGDAFKRSTIEGAYLSGHAAARDLLANGNQSALGH